MDVRDVLPQVGGRLRERPVGGLGPLLVVWSRTCLDYGLWSRRYGETDQVVLISFGS